MVLDSAVVGSYAEPEELTTLATTATRQLRQRIQQIRSLFLGKKMNFARGFLELFADPDWDLRVADFELQLRPKGMHDIIAGLRGMMVGQNVAKIFLSNMSCGLLDYIMSLWSYFMRLWNYIMRISCAMSCVMSCACGCLYHAATELYHVPAALRVRPELPEPMWRQNIVATKPSSRIMIVKAAIGPNRAPQGHPFLEYVGRHRAKNLCQVRKRHIASKASSAMEC